MPQFKTFNLKTINDKEGSRPVTTGIHSLPTYVGDSTYKPTKAEFDQFFDQYWPMLYRGYSFPMHDDIVHSNVFDEGISPSVSETQDGSLTDSNEPHMGLEDVKRSGCKICKKAASKAKSTPKIPKEIFVKQCIKDKTIEIHNKRDLKYKDNYEPHMGFTEMSFGLDVLRQLGAVNKINLTEKVMSQIETIVALFTALQYCESPNSFAATLFLYLRTHIHKSVVGSIHDYLLELFVFKEPHSSHSKPQWLEFARNIKDNWALCKDNKIFKQFSRLMGVVVVLNLCEASAVTFSINGYKLFEPCIETIHGNAMDVIDAGLSTVTFFIETMYNCFIHKSLKPLIMGDTALLELDEEYATIINWWELVKNGNLMRVAGISDSEFDRRLETITGRIKQLMQSLRGFEKKITGDKFIKLLAIKNDYVTRKISSGVRKAPFCIEFFGSSSQGKTTCAEQMIVALLVSAGLPTDRTYWAAFNTADKYMSNWSTDKLVLQFDDIANTKSQFVETSPTQHIINICNNQPFCANMADLSSKGKIFVEPEIVTATTNIKDLDARLYSNCPYSIQRRMHVVITVEAKKKYQLIVDGKPQGLDSAKIAAEHTVDGVYTPPIFDDIWELTIERAVQPNHLGEAAGYKPIIHRGRSLVKVPFKVALNFVIEEYARHRTAQDCIIKSMNCRDKQVIKCPEPGCIYIQGCCRLHQTQPHYGEELIKMASSVPDKVAQIADAQIRSAESYMVKTLLLGGAYAASRCSFYHFIPSWIVKSPIVQHWYVMTHEEEVRRQYVRLSLRLWLYHLIAFSVSACISYSLFEIFHFFLPIIICSLIVFQTEIGERAFDIVKQQLVSSNELVPSMDHRKHFRIKEILMWLLVMSVWIIAAQLSFGLLAYVINLLCAFVISAGIILGFYQYFERQDRLALFKLQTFKPAVEKFRDDSTKYVVGSVVVLGALYMLAKCYKLWKNVQPQGSLEPLTEADIIQRDREVNVWTGVEKRPLPITDLSKTVSESVLEDIVEKNLLYATITAPSGNMMANVLFVDSNLALVPNHYFLAEEMPVTFRKHNPDTCGGKFNSRISIQNSVLIENTDYRLCYVYNGGSFRNLVKHFPLDMLPNHPFKMMYRMRDGSLIHCRGFAKTGTVCNGAVSFIGSEYQNLTMDTFKGMCGATAISQTQGCVISGFHLGGVTGTNEGCSGMLTQKQIVGAIDQIRSLGLLKTGSGGTFKEEVMNVKILTHKDIHYKSPIKYMPQNSQITYHGTCTGMSTTQSSVRVTPISHIVMDVCDVPNKWGPPKMKPEYFGWQTCLANMSIPGDEFPHGQLKLAMEDYIRPLEEIIVKDMYKDVVPLCDQENIMGRPGCRFIDAIKLGTSIGYPLSGNKRNYIVELEDNTITFTPLIWEEINRCLETYKRGERAYPIAKAVKKDEVVSKDKCRIFYGNPISLTFLIRRYYLPLIRFLQLNPLMAECAVGINSHGPEWDDLHKHFTKYCDEDGNRLIGGDYSKYDQKLPTQLILSALQILNRLARVRGYSDEDVKIMEAMAGDIVYAMIAYNGDLISLTSGAHISGNSLTVIINGICGSLNARLYWLSLNKTIPFREAVAFMTYGDDNLGSVHEEHTDFNIKGFSHFLKQYGQTYTMPNKEDELSEWLPPEQLEFLKRKSSYIPELGRYIGALSEDSIFKSLHCFLREKGSPLTQEQACAINIDGALREWFNHGRDVYENRRLQMIKVAQLASIDHMCSELNWTFEDRVQNWFDTYNDLGKVDKSSTP